MLVSCQFLQRWGVEGSGKTVHIKYYFTFPITREFARLCRRANPLRSKWRETLFVQDATNNYTEHFPRGIALRSQLSHQLDASSRPRKNRVSGEVSARVASSGSPWEALCGDFRLVGAPRVRFRPVHRHYSPDSLRGNGSGQQVSHAHQVVGRAGEGKHPIHFQRSAMPHLA